MSVVVGLLGGVLVLAVPVAALVWLARSARRADGGERDTGRSLRRLLQFAILLAALVAAAIGLARLLEVALPAGARLAGRGASELALGLSLVLVGVPAWGGLWAVVRRGLRRDPDERASTAWPLYLAVAGSAALVVALVRWVEVLRWAFAIEDYRPEAVAGALVWSAAWALHIWLLHQPALAPTGRLARLPVIAGSAAGLVALAVGVGGALAASLGELYRALTGGQLVAADLGEELRRSGAVVLVAAPVWWWHWLRDARRGPRTGLWHAYLLVLPLAGALLASLGAAATVLQATLEWFLAAPAAARAAAHFDQLPGALATLTVGALAWVHHRMVLGPAPEAGAETSGSEAHRAHLYLLSAAGLLTTAAGVAVAISSALEPLAPPPIAATGAPVPDLLALALTLLLLGVPLWAWSWRRAQARARAGGAPELRAVSRRAYLVLLFGAAGLAGLGSLVVILFVVLRELLEGTLGPATVHEVRAAVALALTAGALSGYHWTVHREDRARLPEPAPRPPRDVLLVSASGARLAEQVAALTGATVRALRRLDAADAEAVADAETVAAAVLATPDARVLVVVEDGGEVRVIPYAPPSTVVEH